MFPATKGPDVSSKCSRHRDHRRGRRRRIRPCRRRAVTERRLGPGGRNAPADPRRRARADPARALQGVHARRAGAGGEPADGTGRRAGLARAGRVVGNHPDPARSGRQLPAVPRRGVLDHGAGPRGAAPGHQDLRRRRHRRPDGDGRGRHRPARLPRLGPHRDRLVVHRPLLPPRHQRLHQLLRARPARQPARHVRRERRRGQPATPLDALNVPAAGPRRPSSCAPTASRWSPTRRTPPTSAARRTSPPRRSR